MTHTTVIFKEMLKFLLPESMWFAMEFDIELSTAQGISEKAKLRIFLITFSSKGDWHFESALKKKPAKRRLSKAKSEFFQHNLS